MKVIDFGLSDFIRPGNDCIWLRQTILILFFRFG